MWKRIDKRTHAKRYIDIGIPISGYMQYNVALPARLIQDKYDLSPAQLEVHAVVTAETL